MNILYLTEILWKHPKFLDEFSSKLDSFTSKYLSSPIAGYVVFIILFVLAVMFIRGFSNK